MNTSRIMIPVLIQALNTVYQYVCVIFFRQNTIRSLHCALGIVGVIVALLVSFGCTVEDRTASSVTSAQFLPSSVSHVLQDHFYDTDAIQDIYLTISPDEFDRMEKALPERIYVPGSFQWNDFQIDNVGIRYKGNSSSMPPQMHVKRSFLIKFSEYLPGQRFIGLRRVSLDNGIQFGGLFSERIMTDILRDENIRVFRTNYARVFLNGEYLGVSVNQERIDKSFLERYFRDSSGLLYKCHEGGPGADFTMLDTPRQYAHAFIPKTHQTGNDFELLAEFISFINTADDAQFRNEIGRRFDIISFLDIMAVMLFSGAFDQYTGWGAHNYYLYYEPSSAQWSYLLWDLDVGFVEQAFEHLRPLDFWNAAYPFPAAPRPLLQRIVEDDLLLEEYRRRADRILETHFHPDVLVPKLHGLYDKIKESLKDDPYPDRRMTVPTDRNYDDVVDSMETFIRKRYAKARHELDHPQETPPMPMGPPPGHPGGPPPGHPGGPPPGHPGGPPPGHPGGPPPGHPGGPPPGHPGGPPPGHPGGPPPGHPGAGQQPTPGESGPEDPVGLQIESVEHNRVVMKWENKAHGQAGLIIQRCQGEGCIDFMNHHGMPGEGHTMYEDRQVQSGVTYRYRVYAIKPTPHGPLGTGVSNTVTVTIP